MSKHGVAGGDTTALLVRFCELKQKAFMRTGKPFPIIVIQEAGLEGFWIHRVLQSEGIESHVVDPASIATSRRRRRAKTDRIDGETLVRALLAYKRGEPRVCAMVRAPTSEVEDIRGHVSCSFLALVLKKELEDRIANIGKAAADGDAAARSGSWPDILADLDSLTETEVEQDGKRFLLRSAPRPAVSLALRAAGVALPPTVRQLAGA